MKNFPKSVTIIISLSVILLFAGMVNTKPNTVVDDVLWVPKASQPPIIDGMLDGLWYSVTNERATVLDPSTGETDDWYDLFPTFRVMWDDTYLYMYILVIDEEVRTDGANTYDLDGVEFYFDADNSKTEGNYDGIDDVQLRINYDDVDATGIDVGYGTGGNWGYDASGIMFAIADYDRMDGGYMLEVAFPLADLQIDPEVDLEFGMDIQINDNDTGARDHMYRWWADNNDEWKDASLFGTAMLSSYMADSVMQVVQAPSEPTIDGELDDVWLTAPVISHNTYVYVPEDQFMEIDYWEDLQLAYRVMWDENNFYFFADVIDDEINTTRSESWLNDGFELYFDGDDSKNDLDTGYDENDLQVRWVYGDEAVPGAMPNAVHAWLERADDPMGYTFELKIPADDLPFYLEEGAVLGWEVQTNDNDEGERQNMARWWSDDNDSWRNASLFGTIELAGGAVSVKRIPQAKVDGFKLAQNYPNPFNPNTSIVYTLPNNSQVKLAVYDVLGKEIAVLINQMQAAGSYKVEFDAADLTSGVYFYKLYAGSNVITRKMMLLK